MNSTQIISLKVELSPFTADYCDLRGCLCSQSPSSPISSSNILERSRHASSFFNLLLELEAYEGALRLCRAGTRYSTYLNVSVPTSHHQQHVVQLCRSWVHQINVIIFLVVSLHWLTVILQVCIFHMPSCRSSRGS